MNDEFKLGDYHVFPQHNKITTEGSVVKLEPKIMQVLCLLVSNQGKVLSREDIAEKLWPEAVVGLEVITRAIFELRKVLADDPKKPKYIETIARKGYCFIAKVESKVITSEAPLVKSFNNNKTVLAILLSTIFICGLIALAIILLFSDDETLATLKAPLQYQSAILSDGNNFVHSAAMSPDWSKILYVQTTKQSSTSSIFLKDVNTHEPSLITTSAMQFRSPIWGNTVDVGYFVQCSESFCEIVNVNLSTKAMHSIFKTKYRISSIKLSRDSNKIALSLLKNQRAIIGLLAIKTGQLELLPIAMGSNNYAATFSADSLALYYIEKNNGQSKINHFDLLTKKETLISKKFAKISSLYLLSEKTLLIAGKVSNNLAIWKLSVDTNEVSQISAIPANNQAYNLVANKDLQQVFYLNKSSNFDIAAKGLPSTVNVNSLNSQANDLNSLWSNLHQSIYFSSQRTGHYELWSHSKNTNKKLTNLQANRIERPILNRDQTKLAFVAQVNNQLYLHIYDLSKQQITFTQEIDKQSHLLSWSNNNESIYMSIASANIYDIWQFDIAKQHKKKIALAAGLIAKESVTGQLVFGDLTNRQLMIKNSNGSTDILKSFKNISLLVRPHSIKYLHNDQRVLYVEKHPLEQKVVSSSLSHSADKKVTFSLSTDSYITDLGKHESNYVLFDKLNTNTSQLTLLNAAK